VPRAPAPAPTAHRRGPAAAGRTLNEHYKTDRYAYLQTAEGAFVNPYSRGFIGNVLWFFNIAPPAARAQPSLPF